MVREKVQKLPREIVRLSSDICVTVIITCRPTDNAYADNKMDVGIGILFQVFIYRVSTISLVNQSFLRVKHLPLFVATDFLRRKLAPRGILISNCKKRIADERYAVSHRELIHFVYVTFLSRAISQRIITGTGARCRTIGKRESIARNRHYPLKGEITVNRCYILKCAKNCKY